MFVFILFHLESDIIQGEELYNRSTSFYRAYTVMKRKEKAKSKIKTEQYAPERERDRETWRDRQTDGGGGGGQCHVRVCVRAACVP